MLVGTKTLRRKRDPFFVAYTLFYIQWTLSRTFLHLELLPQCLQHSHLIQLNFLSISISLSQASLYLKQKFRSRCDCPHLELFTHMLSKFKLDTELIAKIRQQLYNSNTERIQDVKFQNVNHPKDLELYLKCGVHNNSKRQTRRCLISVSCKEENTHCRYVNERKDIFTQKISRLQIFRWVGEKVEKDFKVH